MIEWKDQPKKLTITDVPNNSFFLIEADAVSTNRIYFKGTVAGDDTGGIPCKFLEDKDKNYVFGMYSLPKDTSIIPVNIDKIVISKKELK